MSGVCGEEEVVEKWKKVVKNLLICAGIIIVTIIADFIVQDYIYKNKCEIVEDDFSHVFQIDSVEQKNNKLVLNGWIFELDKDSVEDDFEVILYDYNNDKEYYMPLDKILSGSGSIDRLPARSPVAPGRIGVEPHP